MFEPIGDGESLPQLGHMAKKRGKKGKKVEKIDENELLLEKLLEQIQRYSLRGYSARQVRDMLSDVYPNLTLDHVKEFLVQLNRNYAARVSNIGVEQALGKSIAMTEEVQHELWKQYMLEKKPSTKASIAVNINNVEQSKNNLLEKMGLLVPVSRVIVESEDSWEQQMIRQRAARGLPPANSYELAPPDEDEVFPVNELADAGTHVHVEQEEEN